MRSRARAIGLVLIASLGCTSADTIGGVTNPCAGLDPDSLACAMAWVRLLDRDRCRALRDCDGVAISDELCEVFYPPEGAWDTIETERNRIAFEEGRIRFDPDGVRCMLERSARCDSNPYDEPTACPPMWVAPAARTQGEYCGSEFECGEGMACTARSQECGILEGRCEPLVQYVGNSCAAGEVGGTCDPRLFLECDSGRCVRVVGIERGGEGAPCNQLTFRDEGFVRLDCAAGLGCDDVTDPLVGRCVRSGTPCGRNDVCGAFTECVDNECVAIATPRVGDACGSAQGLCTWASFGLMCDEQTRRCVETDRLLGQPCADTWAPCIEGVCRFEMGADGTGTHRCGPARSFGEPCQRDLECESHACCAGTCAAPRL